MFRIGISIMLLTTPASAQIDWPDFRGPLADGHVSNQTDLAKQLPLRWSETENVSWKTAIPHRGWSSPVLMDGKIWLTTATVDGHDYFVYCLDAENGDVLFSKKLFHAENPEPLGNDVNCYASPSAVVEDGRVYVHFGTYGTACLNSKTFEVIWKREDINCRHFRGPGSSPFLYGDLLILTMDGTDVQYLEALDKTSGISMWKTARSVDFDDLDANGLPAAGGDFRKAYSTPIIVNVDGSDQLISVGAKAVYGYDPRSGLERWRVRHKGFSAAARPVAGQGMLYLTTGFGKVELLAIRLAGARGDVTDTHIAWRTHQGVPQMPSPLLVDDLLYMVNDNGILSCLEAKSGKQVWRHRLGGNYVASLLRAGDRIYAFGNKGQSIVMKTGREAMVLAESKLDNGFMATPAVSDGALFLRTKTHVYRIDKPEYR